MHASLSEVLVKLKLATYYFKFWTTISLYKEVYDLDVLYIL